MTTRQISVGLTADIIAVNGIRPAAPCRLAILLTQPADQPWEVDLTFPGNVTWTLNRHLLIDGLRAAVGTDSVDVFPTPDGDVGLALVGIGGCGVYRLPRDKVQRFNDLCDQRFDREMAALLEVGGAA